MFVCTIDGEKIRLLDLDFGVWNRIEQAASGKCATHDSCTWVEFMRGPLHNSYAAPLIYQECALQLGVSVPETITGQVLIDAFELETIDEPEGEGKQGDSPT